MEISSQTEYTCIGTGTLQDATVRSQLNTLESYYIIALVVVF